MWVTNEEKVRLRIKQLLAQCTFAQQVQFKLWYGSVDTMPADYLEIAYTQCKNTVEGNANDVSSMR